MDTPWTEQYSPRTFAFHNDSDALPETTLVDMFHAATSEFANKTAFSNMGVRMSFAQLQREADAFTAYLQAIGLEPKDKLAIMSPNLLQYPVVLFGALQAGLTVVNTNPLYTATELKHQLNDAQVKAIVIVENFAHTLSEILPETPVAHIITTQLGDMLPVPKRWLVNTVVKRIKKMVPAFALPNAHTLPQALAKGARLTKVPVAIGADDLAFLQYTGGTTGVAKGAMLSHRNMMANLSQISAFLDGGFTKGEEVVVTALPLYHIFALQASCLLFVKYGCQSMLITNPRDMDALVKTLQKTRFTILPAVNTLFNGLLNHPGFAQCDFSEFKFGLGGGMAVQEDIAKRWHDLTGTALLEGYGLTECAPVVTVNPLNIEAYTGAIGVPLPHTHIKIVDDMGKPLAQGEPGEICVKGPQVMQGYFARPEATAEAIVEGWFMTGDVGYQDERGFIYIVDRKKDMILVSGFNVYPNEIEDAAVKHPAIVEAAAVGEPHPVSGEIVKLFVVSNDPALTAADVIAHCKRDLTGYKVPKKVKFRDELPKSNVGKILRRELK